MEKISGVSKGLCTRVHWAFVSLSRGQTRPHARRPDLCTLISRSRTRSILHAYASHADGVTVRMHPVTARSTGAHLSLETRSSVTSILCTNASTPDRLPNGSCSPLTRTVNTTHPDRGRFLNGSRLRSILIADSLSSTKWRRGLGRGDAWIHQDTFRFLYPCSSVSIRG